MSVSTIIARGFGSWGSINHVVTRGFVPGEFIPTTVWSTLGLSSGDWTGDKRASDDWTALDKINSNTWTKLKGA